MKVLHLDSSALGTASASRELTAAVVRQLRADSPHVEVSCRDLDAQPLPHFTGATLAKSNPAEAELAKAVLDEFLAADVVVIGAPMYNFSLPSTLKAAPAAGEFQREPSCPDARCFAAASRRCPQRRRNCRRSGMAGARQKGSDTFRRLLC